MVVRMTMVVGPVMASASPPVLVAGQSSCGQGWSDDGDDDHGGPRLGQ